MPPGSQEDDFQAEKNKNKEAGEGERGLNRPSRLTIRGEDSYHSHRRSRRSPPLSPRIGAVAQLRASFEVVGEASSTPEAMTVIRQQKPTMAIVDLGLKGPNGIELTKSLRAEFPKMPVLVLSMHDEPTYAVRSLRAGANGYVTKEEALSSVLVAVREVIAGRTYLSPGMASDVISNVVLTKAAPGGSLTDQLTDRELEILERIGKGQEVKAIAKALHLSPKTVETHRAHIKEKLNLSNARQVARFAVQWTSAREG